jgi:hypothetical protein
VRPLLACEDSDALLRERAAEPARPADGGVELRIEDGKGSVFVATSGPASFTSDACWYRDFKLSVDEARGYVLAVYNSEMSFHAGTIDSFAPEVRKQIDDARKAPGAPATRNDK